MTNEETYTLGPWSNNTSLVTDITPTFGFNKVPIGNITITDNENQYNYEPKEDITPYEVSLLIKLFIVSGASSAWHGFCYDYWKFVTDNNLERHFKKVEK
jgi:hypothetical protein